MAFYPNPFAGLRGRARASLLMLPLFTVSIAACGGDSGTEQTTGPPPPPPMVVASGTFDVTAEVLFNTCGPAIDRTGTYDIVIDSDTFEMGTEWVGDWDQRLVSGFGESERTKRIIRFCTITEWTVVNVQFTSEDEFTGEIVLRRRVDGDCSTACNTTWRIRGTRQPATP